MLVEIVVLEMGWISSSANFSGNGESPTNDCWRQKTRVPWLSYRVVCVDVDGVYERRPKPLCPYILYALCMRDHRLRLAVLVQYWRVTDGRTDRRTDRRWQQVEYSYGGNQTEERLTI